MGLLGNISNLNQIGLSTNLYNKLRDKFGGGGGGGDNQQTVKSESSPPPWLANALNQYGTQLSGFMQSPSSQFGYPGGDVSPYTYQGISALANPDYWNQSGQYFSDVASGNYLGLNPEMQAAVVNPAIEAVNNRYNALGRFGSGQNQQASQLAAMQALMPYYNAERDRQQAAAGILPGIGAGYAGSLMGAGTAEQSAQQQLIARNNWDPRYAALQGYAPLLGVGQGYGTMTSNTTVPGGSGLAGILGTGMMALGLYNGLGAAGLLGGGTASSGAGLLGSGASGGLNGQYALGIFPSGGF